MEIGGGIIKLQHVPPFNQLMKCYGSTCTTDEFTVASRSKEGGFFPVDEVPLRYLNGRSLHSVSCCWLLNSVMDLFGK